MNLINTAKVWDGGSFSDALIEYKALIRTDIRRTKKAIDIALKWNFDKNDDGKCYTKKQAAELVGTTPEAIRNWERNGLIPQSETYKKRYYPGDVLERMYVIRLLLDTGYSIMAILKFLRFMDEGKKKEAGKELKDPEGEDLQSRADYYLKALNKVLKDSGKIKNLALTHHLLI